MRFSNLPYHFGLKVRIYPNYRRKAMIKLNSDIFRFWYNHMVGLDYYKYDIMDQDGYAGYIKNPLVRKWYNNVYNKRKISYAKKAYHFLQNTNIDSLIYNEVYLNHNQAWVNYHNGLQHILHCHSKRKQGYKLTYQTACIYHKDKNGKHVGSVRILDKKHLTLPKLGKVRTSKIRNCILNKTDYKVGRVTISRDNLGHYFVSLQLGSLTSFRTLPELSNKIAMFGYDLNTSNFLQDTNHDYIPNPRYYEKASRKLKHLQRMLSRKYRHTKGKSKNYTRNRLALAKQYKKVANQRTDFLQKHSTKLFENQELLVGENLQSRNMLKNYRIAKSIQSVGWRSFIDMLKYKANMYHRIYVLIDPKYTTQQCDHCGYICNHKDGTHLTLRDRVWICPKCGTYHIRDINASYNILRKGIRALRPYLPSNLRYSVRLGTYGLKSVQCIYKTVLKYLVTHRYYGVLDASERTQAKLHREV